MKNTFENYLIIDLEATCCKERIITREAMEIIEIGAVVVNARTLDVVDEYTTFIKPILNPTLTDFCKTLTTITQDDVDNAIGYKEAIKHLAKLKTC